MKSFLLLTAAQLLLNVNAGSSFRLSVDQKKETTPCGDEGYYFLNIETTGDWEGERLPIRLSVQTLNQRNLRRLYEEIAANVRTKGLPECILNDVYKDNVWRENFTPYHYITFHPVGAPLCSDSGGRYIFPITSCIYLDKVYP